MSKLLSTIVLSVLALVVTPVAYANWTPPLALPPTCAAGSPGCDAPINVSINPQVKAGALNIGPHPNLGSAILTVINDAVQSGSDSGQIKIKSATDQTKTVNLGLDTTSNYGWVQAFKSGTTAYPFAINPLGGRVGINTKAPETTLHIAGTNANFGVGSRGTAGHLWTFTAWSGNSPTDTTQKGFYIVDQDAAAAGAGMGDRMIIDTNGNFKIGLWGNTRAAFELGGGVAGKAANAGRFGYNLFTTQGEGVDIIGGGNSVGTRLVRIWDKLQVCDASGCKDVSTTGGTSNNLPAGAVNQTLRHNGTAWVANTGIMSDGIKASVGFTVPDFSASGPMFNVNGNIKALAIQLTTGAGAGKVLTSDANGLASWQTLPNSANPLPSPGNAGNVLTSNGSSWSSQPLPANNYVVGGSYGYGYTTQSISGGYNNSPKTTENCSQDVIKPMNCFNFFGKQRLQCDAGFSAPKITGEKVTQVCTANCFGGTVAPTYRTDVEQYYTCIKI